ncbi:tRNA-uridine aminocarboxypropyltransferase 1 [Leptopilina boulardi]|uniref:tRNA-uridine aminocarboxypropyltransferase 1 n=1 Tax=Leptopilina boulardi TaxID=63433 RepID=UPI0021F5D2E5|nr:tRNA-uridine aminocarboxypropyltransferase 1 [Leptopilina boulardi]
MENLNVLEETQKIIDRAPFREMKINDTSVLDKVDGRGTCDKCNKSRKYFCYTCYTLIVDKKIIPQVKLPIKIDIIKHSREIDGKSTAVHATILASENVKIYTYPDFPLLSADEKIVLIFPSKTATSVDSFFESWTKNNENSLISGLPITRAIFIDSTWQQTKAIYKEQKLRDLPCVILKGRISQFWRHQKKSPRWYLATIEAIHQFMIEFHMCAFNNYQQNQIVIKNEFGELSQLCLPYSGQYDNLLFFFKHMYEKIHSIYDHEKLYAYKRPLI